MSSCLRITRRLLAVVVRRVGSFWVFRSFNIGRLKGTADFLDWRIGSDAAQLPAIRSP